MAAHVYKPKETHQRALQSLRVWQMRLREVLAEIGRNDARAATERIVRLRSEIQPEVYPEFADNLEWIYTAVETFLLEERFEEAGEAVQAVAPDRAACGKPRASA